MNISQQYNHHGVGFSYFLRRVIAALAVMLMLSLVACDDPPPVPDLVYWDAVADVQDSINAHLKYDPADVVVTIGDTGVVPAFMFDGASDNVAGQPRSFATITLAAGARSPGQEYVGTVYLFPGKGDLDYFNKPLVVGDALDPYNERSASTIYSDNQYRRLLSVDKFYPRGLGYDIYFIDFSQGAGDILVNAALELKLVEWLQPKLAPETKVIIGGPSMSGIVARVAMLYALPENNTTGTYLAPKVGGYFSVDSPHQGASIDPSLTVAARAFYDAMESGWGTSHDIAAGYALHSWRQSTTPATFQMLYAHEILGEYPSSGGHAAFYGFLDQMGQYNKRMPRAAIAYSNFFVPHKGIDPTKRIQSGIFKVRVKVPFNPIDFKKAFHAGGSPAVGAPDYERAGYHELTPGSVGGRFYWSPYSWAYANEYVFPDDIKGERYKGTHIPIYSALDLDPSFDVFNPPTTDETELARYSKFDAVFYMKNEYTGYRPTGQTVNDKRYEHIVFDDQLMQSIADALAFLEEEARSPVAVSDRYDIKVGEETYVRSPGVLSNDSVVNGAPAVYGVTYYPNVTYLSESISQGAYASVDWSSCKRCGKSAVVTMVGNEKRALFLYTPRNTTSTHIAAAPPLAPYDPDILTLDLNAPEAASDAPLALVTSNGDPRLYYLAKDTNMVQELGWWEGNWHYRPVAAEASAPAAVKDSPLAATSITNGNPRVYYLVDINGAVHIQELAYRTLGNIWTSRDLIADTGAPAPILNSPIAAISINSEPRVYYIGAGFHIHELAWDVDQWRWSTITPSAMPTMNASRLTAVEIGNQPRVYFVDNGVGNQWIDIMELAVVDSRWMVTNVSSTAAAPDIFGPSLVATNINGVPHVYYTAAGEKKPFGISQNIHMLTQTGGTWRNYDLTSPYLGTNWFVDTTARLTLSPMVVDRPTVKVELVTDTSHGKLTLHEDGSFTYRPDAGYAGVDSFAYRTRTAFAQSPQTQVLLQVTNECVTPPGNLIVNSCFEGTTTPWQFYSDRYGSFQLSNTNPFEGLSSGSVAIYHQNRKLQLYQENITLQPNTTYELSFAARAEKARGMTVWVHKHNNPYSSYGLARHKVALTSNWQWYRVTFVTPDSSEMKNARLRFWFASYSRRGTFFEFDHVVLVPVK